MKNSTEVIGLPIMGVTEGQECGRVMDIVIDPQKKIIRSVILQGKKNEYDYRELLLGDVIGIGKDYLIIQSVDNAKNLNFDEPGMTLKNVKCIGSSGDVLGNIKDFTFDEKTGNIQSLNIDKGIQVSGQNILTFSNNLIFVNTEGKEAAAPKPFVATPVQKPVESNLQKEQNEFLLGRTVGADIVNEAGKVIVKKDTVITETIINEAEKAGVLIDLTINLA